MQIKIYQSNSSKDAETLAETIDHVSDIHIQTRTDGPHTYETISITFEPGTFPSLSSTHFPLPPYFTRVEIIQD